MTLSLTIHPEPKFLSPYQAQAPKPPSIESSGFIDDFSDVIDAVNPLQHIPVVSNLYREFSGDDVSQGASILGGALFGGPVGLLVSVVNAIIEQESGQSIAGNLFAAASDAYDKTNKLT